MKKTIIAVILSILFIANPVAATDGMISIPSSFNVEETANRMVSILNAKGMTVFNRIKHSENAEKVGIKLRKTELIIFGNPKIGSQLMICQQSVAIDLPQKALIWEDENAKTWISYNDPKYLKKRHEIPACEAVITKIENALAAIAKSAVENNKQ